VIVSLIEPMMGTTFINKSLNDKGGGYYDSETETSSKFKRQREESRGLMYNSVGMIVLEDIPELIIELAYLIRSGGNIENVPLFVITLLLSLWHFFRVVSEIWFEIKQREHIPDPNDPKSNITIVDGHINEIEEHWKERYEICHEICDLNLAKFDNEELMNNFATFMVKHSRSLGKLDLENNKIVNIDNLAKALETNKTLEELVLGTNQIVNIDNLAKALETNKTLKQLFLAHNQIVNIDHLAKALETNKTLNYLFLGDNQIVDIDNLAKALETNKTLNYLSLQNNQIDNIDNLAKALETNKTMKILGLRDNKISEADKQKIKNIWGERGTLSI